MSLIEVKLRPTGPWRVGHRAGDRERVDVVYHSDALYSAVTHAMRAFGWLQEWLDATAGASGDPVVRFSSLFPFAGKTRLVAPPKSLWPPSIPGRLYLQGAKFIPLEIVKNGFIEESRWTVDGESECLLPSGSGSPFRVSMRSAAAVDRVTGATEPHRTACLEFAPSAGWWGVFSVSDHSWEARVKSALRLLADSGFGGERSRGWGRASEPQFSDATHLFAPTGTQGLWWLLSLYSPHETDAVDWSRGEYTAFVRGGWTDSPAGAGAKKQVRMIEEGSVLSAAALRGHAVDVAPDGFPHPVYRAGFALGMPVPMEIVVRAPAETTRPQRAAVTPEPAPISQNEPAEPEAAAPAGKPAVSSEPESIAQNEPAEPEAAPAGKPAVSPEPESIAQNEPTEPEAPPAGKPAGSSELESIAQNEPTEPESTHAETLAETVTSPASTEPEALAPSASPEPEPIAQNEPAEPEAVPAGKPAVPLEPEPTAQIEPTEPESKHAETLAETVTSPASTEPEAPAPSASPEPEPIAGLEPTEPVSEPATATPAEIHPAEPASEKTPAPHESHEVSE